MRDLAFEAGLFNRSYRVTTADDGDRALGGRFDQRTKEANEAQLSINATQAAALGISSTFLPDSLADSTVGAVPVSAEHLAVIDDYRDAS